MIERIARAVARLLNRVRVNHVEPRVEDGAAVFVKRRRAGVQIVIWCANRFLELTRSGSCMFVSAHEWTDWEVHCAHLLYPERPRVKVAGRAVIIPKVGGSSLRTLLHGDEADLTNAFVLAAREVRRAHQIHCSRYQARWSHGDLHLDNIVCDLAAGRALLLDFDTRHEFHISETERHGDDLKVALLELMARPDENWIRPATAFIEEYGESSVLSELGRQLVVPRGVARLLWHVRTNGVPLHRIEPRLPILRDILDRVANRSRAYRDRHAAS